MSAPISEERHAETVVGRRERGDQVYVPGGGESERARLLEQCETHREQAQRLFERLGGCAAAARH